MVRDYQNNNHMDDKSIKKDYSNLSLKEKEKIISEGNVIIEKLKKINIQEDLDETFKLLSILQENFSENPNFDDPFFQLIDSYSFVIKSQESFGNFEIIRKIMEKILLALKSNIDKNDYLAALCDVFLLNLEVFIANDFVEDTEEYIKFIVKLSLKYPNNIIIKSTAAESIIIVQSGFGRDWNYEKCIEYGKLIRTLLPPLESKGIFAGILIKALADEIDVYGEMNEFSELTRSFNLMCEIYSFNKDCKFDVLANYSLGLIRALKWYGEIEKSNKITIILQEIDELTNSVSCPEEVKLSHAQGISTALDLANVIENFDLTIKYAKKIISFSDEFPNNIEMQHLALTSVLKVANWASIHWDTGILLNLLSALKRIEQRSSDDELLIEQYAKGLFLLTREISQIGNQRILLQIIDDLQSLYERNNRNIEITVNFSKAIINMTYLLGEISDSHKLMISYLEQQKELHEAFPENAILLVNYSKTLVNTIRMLGLDGDISQMENYLDILRDLALTNDNRAVFIRLGKGLIDAILAYGEVGEVEKISSLINDLEDLAEEDFGDIELQLNLVKGLVNAISGFGKNDLLIEMSVFFNKLKELSLEYEGILEIQQLYANGIALVIKYGIKNQDLLQVRSQMQELADLSSNYSKNPSIQSTFARSLRRVLIFALEKNDQKYLKELMANLRLLFEKNPIVEDIQLEFARALAQQIIFLTTENESEDWQNFVMEFKGLRIQFPKNERLNKIYQLVSPFIND